MEFSSPKIKKIFMLHKKNYEKNPLQESLLYFGKWNFLTPRLKIFFYFLKKSFSYILENRTF